MKLFILAAVLSFTFVVVSCAAVDTTSPPTSEAPKYTKKEEAAKLCNVTYPVTEDIRKKLALFVLKGETIPKEFNTTEWCNLYCNLEKVGFFDSEGKMRVRGIFKYVIRSLPDLAANSHTLVVQLFQINRSVKNMEDKCMKAFVAYYRFTEAIMVASMAIDLNANTDIREAVIDSVLYGEEIPKEFDASVEKYLKNAEAFFAKTVESNANITPVPSA